MLLRRGYELSRFGVRRLTASLRLRPSFLVIGAQKAGTTSLHDYLAKHSAVLPAVVKEVHYFHRYYPKGARWYRSRFPLKARAALVERRIGMRPAVGESTPDYLFDPRAPARVHAFDPDMKLIAVLRDPVERAFSHWRMRRRHGTETLSFEDALDREESELPGELEQLLHTDGYLDAPFSTSYVARGRYAEQLERWLAIFPGEQLLVLTSDELLTEPDETMARVWRFLGIPEWRSERYRLRGVQGEASMAAETRERLARVFEPHNRRLEQLLGRELSWTQPGARAMERTRSS